ncbi:hypothetical protein [Streptomyces olivochromogenes]|uniref:Uncharacterized protein n=1 Tax=Streptomyces olivochromogenes TaxID=1963 RepID=A0A250V518_STROL|nr:hypothetical protein [Streptomyces olivochromogenes]KUN49344.1 hypothetical protein AQJ27_02180 [Streptomyces olivochromogenes]GAX49278.1 hypothetical protein SO3561_00766 [Streptomyces olivochromogenes]
MNPPLGRRHFLAVTGASTAAMTLASTGTNPSGAPGAHDANAPVQPFPLGSVTLPDSAFRANQQRNCDFRVYGKTLTAEEVAALAQA